ncbi:MAG: hypothetical protein V3V19_00030 [Cocleimonas sp.]
MIKKYIKICMLLITLLTSSYSFAEYTKSITAGTALENPTTNWAAGDDATTQVNLGFTFPFGSVSSPNNTTQVYINSNGALSFSSWTTYQNTELPTTPQTIIAPYWDDLNPTQGGTIKYDTFGAVGNRRFIVAWDQIPLYSNTATKCTFQVVLFETGNIRFRYSNTSQCNGSDATVGIQENNNDYNQHSLNQTIDLTKDIVFIPTAEPPPPPPPATPLAINVCDDFEKDLSNWTINNSAGIGTQTASSPSHSLFVNGGNNSSATSIPINTSNSFKEITVWIRRGSDSFSNYPENSDDFFIDYLNNTNNWITLEQFLGGGTAGQTYNRTYTAPADAKHNNFRLRFRVPNASGADFDYWHIDDVCLVPSIAFPSISISKTSTVISDPVNGFSSNGNNPKRIPAALVEYNITATNSGAGVADNNSIVITDAIPANTALYVNDISGAGTGPVRFVDGSPPSGLTYTFSSLTSATDNVSFSNNGGTSYNYSPTPDANGVDSSVTHIKMATQGAFLGDSGSGAPSFKFKFRVKIQ